MNVNLSSNLSLFIFFYDISSSHGPLAFSCDPVEGAVHFPQQQGAAPYHPTEWSQHSTVEMSAI